MTSDEGKRPDAVADGVALGEPVALELASRSRLDVDAYVEGVFIEFEARIHGVALAVTRDPEAAAEVTQEAFLRLIREARAGRRPDSPGAWLYRAATNLAISRGRRTTIARRLAPRLLQRDDAPSAERVVMEHERSRLLRDALARLSPDERVALVLSAQGIPGEEIAEHIGRTHGATRTLLTRARRRLHEQLGRLEAGR